MHALSLHRLKLANGELRSSNTTLLLCIIISINHKVGIIIFFSAEMLVNTTEVFLLHRSLLLSILLGVVFAAIYIHADSENNNFTEPGASIAGILCNASRTLDPHTTVNLRPGTHYLTAGEYCVVGNLTDFTISGSSDGETVIECASETGRGLMFSNIVNITLEKIVLRNCGQTVPNDLPGKFNSTSSVYFGPGQKVALLFDQCTNVKLQSVTVDVYYGLAMVSVNSMGRTILDNVTISNSRTLQHDACNGNETDLSCSGAGIAFVYTDYLTNIKNEDAFLVLAHVTVTNNRLKLPIDHLQQFHVNIRDAVATESILLTGGSGLFVYVAQLAYHVETIIQNCVFNDNDGDIGAVVILFYNTIRHTTVHIRDTVFTNNTADPNREGHGGALLLAFSFNIDVQFSFPEYPNNIYNAIVVSDSKFDGNSAKSGGAIFLHRTPQNTSDYGIEIRNSTFSNNIAFYGPAFMSTGHMSTFVQKVPYITLNNVDMYGNRLPSNTAALQDTAALIFIGINIVEIVGLEGTSGSIFHDNDMSALLASNTNIILRGKITFENNRGFNGGAISMYDNSILFFHESSAILFTENTAAVSGGAIYANSLGSIISKTCVIQVLGPNQVNGSNADLLKLSITFSNNSAGESGNSIFGDPLFQCFYIPEASIMHTSFFDNNEEVYDHIFSFEEKFNNSISEVTSSPERICLCTNSTYNFSECEMMLEVSVVPGQSFEIYLVPVDRAGNPVASILSSELMSRDGYSLGRDQKVRSLPGTIGCTQTQFSIYGPENGELTLFLSPSVSVMKSLIQVNISSCPPGFFLPFVGTAEHYCRCSDFVMNNMLTTCNMTTYTVRRPEQVWFGLHDTYNTSSDIVYVSTCPVNYCNDKFVDINLKIPDHLCEAGRTGLLCGACKEGLSTVFGSADCLECSNSWLAMILLFALLGFLLVFLLFLLDLTVTHGTITGLIFYVNVVSVNASIFFRESSHGFLFIFISLLNLDLGFPLCFYDGMSEIAKVGLQYIFPSYLLLICVVIILLSRWVKPVQRLTAKNGIKVLATLFYLSYSKVLRTAIDSLSFATLRSSKLDAVTIWLFDGNIHYFEGIHLFLFLLATLIMLLFLVPYPLYLTLINVIQKFHTSQRLTPFLDACLAPYKDKWRFWFGIRVIILFLVCIVFAIQGTDNPGLNLLIQHLFVISFLVTQAHCQPFKNMYINMLDLFFLFNFCVLSLIVGAQRNNNKQNWAVSVLISLVFVVFCGILAYHVILALHKVETFKKAGNTCLTAIKVWYDKKRGVVSNTSFPPEERDGETNRSVATLHDSYTHTTSVISLYDNSSVPVFDQGYSIELREPVLEYASDSVRVSHVRVSDNEFRQTVTNSRTY